MSRAGVLLGPALAPALAPAAAAVPLVVPGVGPAAGPGAPAGAGAGPRPGTMSKDIRSPDARPPTLSPRAGPLALLHQPDLAAVQLAPVQLVQRPLHVRPRAELHDALKRHNSSP